MIVFHTLLLHEHIIFIIGSAKQVTKRCTLGVLIGGAT
jgi:hypothetical protein